MSISLSCPKCTRIHIVSEALIGKTVRCPRCKAVFVIGPLRDKEADLSRASGNSQLEHSTSVSKREPVASFESLSFPGYDKYRHLTGLRDWKGICAFNNVPFDSFGTRRELKVLHEFLEAGEVVFALATGTMPQTHTSNRSDSGINTWLVVLTDERFLFLDHAFFTRSIDTQIIRHENVQAVSSSQGWIFGKITIDLGSRTVVVDNIIKTAVTIIATLSNKWLSVSQGKRKPKIPSTGKAVISPIDELKKLADLHAVGALTDNEFTAAKAKILSSM